MRKKVDTRKRYSEFIWYEILIGTIILVPLFYAMDNSYINVFGVVFWGLVVYVFTKIATRKK